MKKFLLLILIIIIIGVGVGAFYGGMKYGQSKVKQSRFSPADWQGWQNLSPEERQQRFEELGINNGAKFRSRAAGSGVISGEIIAKDDKSITVKLPNGGSKIVFFSNSTEITKPTPGTLNDLEVGKSIIADGTTNGDGSITAQTIQLRPQRQ